MGLFKSKPEKVLEDVERFYTAGMASVHEQLSGSSTVLRLEMARYHHSTLEMACLRALKDRGMAPEPEMLSRDYWAITCLRYGLGAPDAVPNPWDARPGPKPVSPLTKQQRKTVAARYQEAFDQWMVVRIEKGSDSPEDFARGDFYAWSTSCDVFADDDTTPSDEELSALRNDLYESNVKRLGYTHRLPHPLPMKGA